MNGVAEFEKWPARDRQRMPAGAVCHDDTPGGRQRGPRTVVAVRIASAAGQLEGEAGREIEPHRQSHLRPRNLQPVVPHVHQAALGPDQPGTWPDGRGAGDGWRIGVRSGDGVRGSDDERHGEQGGQKRDAGLHDEPLSPWHFKSGARKAATHRACERASWRPAQSNAFTIRHHTASRIGRRRRAASAQSLRCLQRPVNTGFRLASSADIPSRASSVVRLAA